MLESRFTIRDICISKKSRHGTENSIWAGKSYFPSSGPLLVARMLGVAAIRQFSENETPHLTFSSKSAQDDKHIQINVIFLY